VVRTITELPPTPSALSLPVEPPNYFYSMKLGHWRHKYTSTTYHLPNAAYSFLLCRLVLIPPRRWQHRLVFLLCRFDCYYTRYKISKSGLNQSVLFPQMVVMRLGRVFPFLSREMSAVARFDKGIFTSSVPGGENQSNFFFTGYKVGSTSGGLGIVLTICQNLHPRAISPTRIPSRVRSP